jgi:hypothetical protein
MSQSLYDAQHGMSPEELWARYRQYPWANNVGDMVMQGEPDYWQGPGLPTNVKSVPLPQGMYGVTIKNALNKGDKKPLATLVSSLMSPSDKLFSANHELTHGRQLATDMPDGPDLTQSVTTSEYANHAGEMQARMNAGMSMLPEVYKQFMHPFNYSSTESSAPESLLRLGGIPTESVEQILKNGRIGEMTMANYRAKKAMPKPSIVDLLQSYVPPFISQGMQK